MQGWIDWFNATSEVWANRFWIATWQAVIVIAIAWLLTTLLRRLSPRVRSWIWRLAYVKILLSLFWTTPIELALLPSEGRGSRIEGRETVESGVGSQGSGVNHSAAASTALPDEITSSEPSGAPAEFAKGVEESKVASALPVAETEKNGRMQKAKGRMATTPLVWQSYLVITWLLGLFAVIVWLAADALRAAKLLRKSQPLTDERWLTLSNDVCRRLGLRRAIRLRSSPTARSPVLIRFFRPAIILPQAMIDSSSSATATSPEISPSPALEDRRSESESVAQNHIALAIAHEAAHLRRHDLAWNALAAIVHVALYFHPMVWLAHRRIRLEQEMACDEMVLQKLSAAPQDYGRMLVNVVRRLAAV